MKVLYLHPSGPFGGAAKSLIEAYCILVDQGVTGAVVTPSGSAAREFENAGLDVRRVLGLSQFDNTRYGFYRGLRWAILLREIFLLPVSVAAIWRLRRGEFDILHLNEVTLLPIGLLAKWRLGIPLVVHVRSLQRPPKSGWRTRLINWLLQKHADAVVAIDRTVAKSLGQQTAPSIIHNGLQHTFAKDSRQVKARFCAGYLGVLAPLKGIYELVEAIRILVVERGYDIDCLIAGENLRNISGVWAWCLRTFGFAGDVRRDLDKFIKRHGLENNITMVGFTRDIARVYPQLDVLCFPSHLNATGRPVFEAAMCGVPSVVCVSDPEPDSLLHGITGIAIPEPDARLLADALESLMNNAELAKTMGTAAKEWANRYFELNRNARLLRSIYRHLCPAKACICETR